ncbi:MAG: hypothetical protein JXR48_13040 [Candidatus Delongbacteria bacterium]|nr:hypothetical protein [Candidatus Delongbacteria bacterium]MBN2835879.1 hypothetical protein [Candidatus Delongbacteria bacterium]
MKATSSKIQGLIGLKELINKDNTQKKSNEKYSFNDFLITKDKNEVFMPGINIVRQSYKTTEILVSANLDPIIPEEYTTIDKKILTDLSSKKNSSFIIDFNDTNNITIETDTGVYKVDSKSSVFKALEELKLVIPEMEGDDHPLVFNNSILERLLNKFKEVQKQNPVKGLSLSENETGKSVINLEMDSTSSKVEKDLNINVLSTKDFLRDSSRKSFNDVEGKILNKISDAILTDVNSEIKISKSDGELKFIINDEILFSGMENDFPLLNEFVSDVFTRNVTNLSKDNITNSQKEVFGVVNRMNFLKSAPEVVEYNVRKSLVDNGYSVSISPLKLVERIKEIIKENPDLLENGVLTRIHNFKDSNSIINQFASNHDENKTKSIGEGVYKVTITDPKRRSDNLFDSKEHKYASLRLGRRVEDSDVKAPQKSMRKIIPIDNISKHFPTNGSVEPNDLVTEEG